jgi:tRNA-dihydrouridine synthase B
VFANGDILTPQDAKQVLDYTGAAAVMIGRAAQGNPWIFKQINSYLDQGVTPNEPSNSEVVNVISSHIEAIHKHYGTHLGIRIARKHVGWYVNALSDGKEFRRQFFQLEDPEEQIKSLYKFFMGTTIKWNKAA